MEIQVFTADTAASRGITADDVAFIAANYDGSTGQPAPNVIGHPKDDAPAHGLIESFRAEGPKLFAKLGGKLDAIKAGIKDGTILNRSIMFWHPDHASNPKPGKLWPKHLGFLGAASPGIPNMPPLTTALAFSADAEDQVEITGDAADAVILAPPPPPATGVITFSEPGSPAKPEEKSTVTDEEIAAEKARIKAEADQLAADKLAFAAEQTKSRNAANAAQIDALASAGKVTPADAEDLKLAFAELDKGGVIAFSDKTEKSPAGVILGIMAKGGKVVPVGEDGKPISPEGPAFTAGDGSAEENHRKATEERNAKYGK